MEYLSQIIFFALKRDFIISMAWYCLRDQTDAEKTI